MSKTFNDTGMGRIIAWISARVFKKSDAVTTQVLGIDTTPSNNSSNLITSGGVYSAVIGKEDVTNKVTSISSTSTDTEYPSAKAVYTAIPDVSSFITNSVNNLTNYYKKTETYTQAEVNSLIGAINQFRYQIAASTSAVSSPASNVLYLIGPTGSGADKYEEYVYANNTWVKIGDTSIDLSDYATKDFVEGKGYVTTDTKNTAGSTDTSSKIFLIGATTQAVNPQTYSDNEVYATSGVLTTKSVQVGGTSATMQYNSTDNSIEFVFS